MLGRNVTTQGSGERAPLPWSPSGEGHSFGLRHHVSEGSRYGEGRHPQQARQDPPRDLRQYPPSEEEEAARPAAGRQAGGFRGRFAPADIPGLRGPLLHFATTGPILTPCAPLDRLRAGSLTHYLAFS